MTVLLPSIPTKKLDEIYYTEDYPRAGCRVLITAGKGPSLGWRVDIYPPEKYGMVRALETYWARDAIHAAWVAAKLLTGERLPKRYAEVKNVQIVAEEIYSTVE